MSVVRINCGWRPHFLVTPTRAWQGGEEVAPGRWLYSYETAQKRWRALWIDFIYWRFYLKLWRIR